MFILQQAMYLCVVLVIITAEVSQILVSCETPIYLEQFCLVHIKITCSIWYFMQFVHIVIFISLYVPAGACNECPLKIWTNGSS